MTSSRAPVLLPWGAAAVCAVAGVVVFHWFGNAVRGYIDTGSVFWWWGRQWFLPGAQTEHGPLMLALAGWVLWRNLRRDRSGVDGFTAGASGTQADGDRAMSSDPDHAPTAGEPTVPAASVGRAGPPAAFPWPALAAMGGALALHALGYLVQQTRISIVALLLFTWGVLRLGGGRRWGRAAVFPLLLLLFAIPVGFLETVGFHLRLAVIAATEHLARAAGIDVVRNGTQLFAPDGRYQYDVAAACSGVRSLMALLALSLLIGYLHLRSFGARVGVFLLAFPLTFVGNVVRIAAVVFAGQWIGQRAGEWVHDWAGFIVFVVVLGGVQLAAARLARREAERSPDPSRHRLSDTPERPRGGRPGLAVGTAAVAALAALAAWGTTRVEAHLRPAEAGVRLEADGQPRALPAFIGTEWIGQVAEVTAVERDVLPPDTGYARRTYTSIRDRRRQVFLSIVLSGQDRTSIHRPELCLVGQGWTIQQRATARFAHPEGGTIPAAVLHLSREVVGPRGQRQTVPALFAYWFVGRETLVTTTAERMWHTALNRLRLRPDRWAYVVAQTLVLPGESETEAMARIQEVLDGTVPEFQTLASR